MPAVGVDLAGTDAQLLTTFVEHGHGLVGGRHQQHLIAGLAVPPPRVDGSTFHLRAGAALEAVVRVVQVEHVDVTTA